MRERNGKASSVKDCARDTVVPGEPGVDKRVPFTAFTTRNPQTRLSTPGSPVVGVIKITVSPIISFNQGIIHCVVS